MLSLTACLSQFFLTLTLLFFVVSTEAVGQTPAAPEKTILTALPFAPSINSELALSPSTNQPFILSSFVEG
jgi:hypothetical protein